MKGKCIAIKPIHFKFVNDQIMSDAIKHLR